jgi:triacylglycerol lipase
MIRICARAAFRAKTPLKWQWQRLPVQRFFSCTSWRKEDPRIEDFGRRITDDFAQLREKYGMLDIPYTMYATPSNTL